MPDNLNDLGAFGRLVPDQGATPGIGDDQYGAFSKFLPPPPRSPLAEIGVGFKRFLPADGGRA